jgi:hypothetical protein
MASLIGLEPTTFWFGAVLVSLLDKLSAQTQGKRLDVHVLWGDYHGGAIFSALLAKRLFLCEPCAERIKKMMEKLREQGAIPREEPPNARAPVVEMGQKLGVN